MNLHVSICGLVCIALLTSIAQAGTIINLDFQESADHGFGALDPPDGITFTGVGAIGIATPTWNAIDGFPIGTPSSGGTIVISDTDSNLLDENGSPTSIDVTVVGTNNRVGANNSIGNHNNLTLDYYFRNSTSPLSLTLEDLNPTSTYDVYLYTSRNQSGSRRGASFSIDATTQTANGQPTSIYHLGQSYVVFSGLSPDINGDIAITVLGLVSTSTSGDSSYGFLAGIQIEEFAAPAPPPAATPEPSTLVLGLMSLAFRRRKRTEHC